ncbi:MAG: hypothetical protein AAF986_05790 [Pseudomonadota bacterium]
MRSRKTLEAPFPVIPAAAGCIVLFAIFAWGPNLALLVLSLVTLFAGAWLCWRPGEPGIALFLFGYQWIQASIAIFVANMNGISINQMAQLSTANMADATALTFLGLIVLFGAFRLAAGPPMTHLVKRARTQAQYVRPRQLLIAYAVASVGAFVLTYLSSFSEGIRQPLLAFASIKEAIFFIIAFVGLVKGGSFRWLFYGVFALEFLISLQGYFSSFQTVFIYTFIAAIAANIRLGAMKVALLGAFVAFAVLLASVWSAVKTDYRAYLNGGTGQQIVTVSWADAVGTLFDMALQVDGEDLADGVDKLSRRLTYVEFFGATLNNVPKNTPHTDGELWLKALVHPFTPRLFFPNKPITDSSAETNKYSGIRVAGWETGTQISIGYFGESYIDFGPWGMFFPLALYGAVAGATYRRVLQLPVFSGLIGFGLSLPLLMGANHLGSETIKIVGAFVITAIAIFITHRFAGAFVQVLVFGRQNQRRMLRSGDITRSIHPRSAS